MGITSREPGTVRGTAKRPHFSLAFISVTVQLWTKVFWVISVYFNIRNTLPKFCPFLLGHTVYIYSRFLPCLVQVKSMYRPSFYPSFTPSSVYGMPLQNVGTSTPHSMKSSPTTRIFQICHIVTKIVTFTISLNNVCVYNALLEL